MKFIVSVVLHEREFNDFSECSDYVNTIIDLSPDAVIAIRSDE